MKAFPLTAIPLLVYLIGVIATGGLLGADDGILLGDGSATFWEVTAVELSLVSGVGLPLTWRDCLTGVALAILVVGVVGTSSVTGRSVASVMFPMIGLGVYVVLFLTVPAFGTSTFLTLTLIATAHTIACVAVLIRVRDNEASG